MSNIGKQHAGRRQEPALVPQQRVQVLVVAKEHGGISIREATVPANAIEVSRVHPPDVIDIAMSRLERLVQLIARGGK
jgi:hypothetical protein